jgi:hypothetical protein
MPPIFWHNPNIRSKTMEFLTMNNIVRNISNNVTKTYTNVFYVMENYGYQLFNRM